MTQYPIDSKTRIYVKGYRFLLFGRKHSKQVLGEGLHVSKKVVHKGNKISDALTKSNDDNIEKQEPIKEVIIPVEKIEEIFKKLRRVL